MRFHVAMVCGNNALFFIFMKFLIIWIKRYQQIYEMRKIEMINIERKQIKMNKIKIKMKTIIMKKLE